jgi:hypothetical protein
VKFCPLKSDHFSDKIYKLSFENKTGFSSASFAPEINSLSRYGQIRRQVATDFLLKKTMRARVRNAGCMSKFDHGNLFRLFRLFLIIRLSFN